MSPIYAELSNLDYKRIQGVLDNMQQELDAQLVLLIHRAGQQIACAGPSRDLDLTALSSLAAATLAATDGLAQLVGEREFSVLFQQGRVKSIHISSLYSQFCLVLLFGEKVSPGMVRWKARRASDALARVLKECQLGSTVKEDAADTSSERAQLRYFTDREIDKLFGQ
jgi:predicted regulator of Ras-like GTPase activity (Roadblock/LC7/MglB family)